MSEWKKVKLGDCCEITSSKRIFFSEYSDNGIPFYRSKEIIELSKGQSISEPLYITENRYNEIKQKFGIPQENDILLTSVGSIGIPFMVNKRDKFYFKDGNLTWLRNYKDFVFPCYIFYWLKSNEAFNILNNIALGAAQKALTIVKLKDIEVPLPSINAQHRIATILSRYDSLIENYQKQIKLLEEAAQRLYKEWFVDLHFPGHENVKIVDGMPEGWEKKSVTDVLEIKYGKDHKLLKDGTNPVYGTGGVMRYVEKSLCTGESVLIPRKGSLNNILLVDGTFWTIDTMFYSIPKEDNVAKIVYFYLKGVDMYSFNIGAAVPSMTVNILSGMKLLIPKDDIRKEFEKIVSIYFIHVQSLQSQIRILTEARDRLLPKLMSGEIEI